MTATGLLHRFLIRSWSYGREAATRNESDTNPPSRDANRARVMRRTVPSDIGGCRKRRVPAAPAASCAMCRKHTSVVTTGSAGITRRFLRNGFNGFLRALLGDRAFLPPSPAGNPANLTPASGRQDHTTSPSARPVYAKGYARLCASPPKLWRRRKRHSSAQYFIAPDVRASIASNPASVTIAIRPSRGVGRLESIKLLLPIGEAKYFCKDG